MICAHCNKNLTPWSHPYITKGNDDSFCNPDCMKSFYIRKIEKLELSIKKWKEAWWEQREIIGKHGLKIMRIEHPDYFK